MRVTVNVLPAGAVWAGEELREAVVGELARDVAALTEAKIAEGAAGGPDRFSAPDGPADWPTSVRRERQGTVAWSEVMRPAPAARDELRITVAHLAN